MDPALSPHTRCDGCGLVIEGGAAACQALFDELLAQSFTNLALMRVHRMVVDTYALQHPDRYCASVTSLAAHLTGLCWVLEYKGNRATGSDQLRRWLNSRPQIDKPPIPAFRGRITVDVLQGAADGARLGPDAERWARDTWDAYAPLHALAHQWVAAGLDYRGMSR